MKDEGASSISHFSAFAIVVLLFEVRVRVRDLIFVNMALIARQLHY